MRLWSVAVISLSLLAGCATGGERFRIRPDEALLAGRDAWVKGPALAPKRKLNVVLIVADDLGRSDVSMYPGGRVATPNIDRIANEGVAFSAGYVTAALCSPSRAGLLTGRYQQRFGHEAQPHDRYAKSAFEFFFAKHFAATEDWRFTTYQAPDDVDVQKQGLPPSELTLAELLKRAGYATGMFGKWHLGWSEAVQPQRRGFDEFYGFYEAYSLYASPPEQPGIVNQHLNEFSDPFIWGRGRSGISAIVHNSEVVDEHGYLPDRLTDEAIAFITAHRAQPFFVYLPYQNPHTPFQAKAADVQRFANEPDPVRRTYLALIASLDDSVGRVLDTLETSGLSKDTLVIFISDNGGALYTHATSNEPFQGGKFTLFEGGVRVPFAMRWPGVIAPQTHYDEPVSALDIVSTVTSAVGIALPRDRTYDGVDLVPYVRKERQGAPHDALYWRAGYTSAIRKGSLKLIRDRFSNVTALFDLASDPSESHDLAPSRSADVAELLHQLDAWSAEAHEPLWPTVMDYRFVSSDGREFWYPL